MRGGIPGRCGIGPGGGADLLQAGTPSAATGLRMDRRLGRSHTGDRGTAASPPPRCKTSTRAGSVMVGPPPIVAELVRVVGGELRTDAPELNSAPERGRVAGAGIRPGG